MHICWIYVKLVAVSGMSLCTVLFAQNSTAWHARTHIQIHRDVRRFVRPRICVRWESERGRRRLAWDSCIIRFFCRRFAMSLTLHDVCKSCVTHEHTHIHYTPNDRLIYDLIVYVVAAMRCRFWRNTKFGCLMCCVRNCGHQIAI